ncbi:MAG: hypothetical protein ABW022_08450 [Actinoplanes sp.]
MTDWNPQPGDWVTITGKIVELHPNDVDLGVEVFSKTDQYTAFVRRDLCSPAEKPIPAEPDEGSAVLVGSFAYQRQERAWYAADADEVPRSWLDPPCLSAPACAPGLSRGSNARRGRSLRRIAGWPSSTRHSLPRSRIPIRPARPVRA